MALCGYCCSFFFTALALLAADAFKLYLKAASTIWSANIS